MRNHRYFLLDTLLLAGLPVLAVSLRFESFSWPPWVADEIPTYAMFALVVRLGVAFLFGLYRARWSQATPSDLRRIAYAGMTSGILTVSFGANGLTALSLGAVRLPLVVLALDAVSAVVVLATPRLLARFGRHLPNLPPNHRRGIVVGAGVAGQLFLRESRLNEKLDLRILCFVDDDPRKQQQLLSGIPVLGTLADLPSLISRLGIDEVIMAMPRARGRAVRRVVQAASDAGIQVRTIPGSSDALSGQVNVSALRHVEIQDLLRRDEVVTDLAAVRELATGRTVLVTGAGGSIGSELCRQIAALEPSELLAIDHSENQIFEIERELRRQFPALRLVPIIADIRDPGRLHAIVGRHRPHAIFHAAAHKHVPLMEENIVEAVTNNVLGTRNVVDAALDADTAHLVNISTDKAVRPTSVMGVTKRIAELIVLNAALAEGRNLVSVRFGNVLGSSGSVVPTFLRQIKEGGPVTVTHPEMRRYFMTIPEAVQLVLQAGALGRGGELFVLNMGDPVKIADLARDLIRLSGLEEGVDIDVAFTGVRPGEKLYEELLFGGEDVRPTTHPKVLRAVGDTADPSVPAYVESLIRSAVAYTSDDRDLRDQLRNLVPEFAREDARTERRTSPPAPLAGGEYLRAETST